MSSPLTTFQTLTNFIPLSWGPRASQLAPAAVAALCLIPESSSTSSSVSDTVDKQAAPPISSDVKSIARGLDAAEKRERRYVSKEHQLEKLRIRLDLGHKMVGCASNGCKKCNGGTVHV